MEEFGGVDLPVRDGKHLNFVTIGGHIIDYNSMIFLTHFKGCASGHAGKATCDHFGKQITFLNVMRRMSVDCDCAGTSAVEPTMVASTDILAIDQACCDFVYTTTDSKDLRERMEVGTAYINLPQ